MTKVVAGDNYAIVVNEEDIFVPAVTLAPIERFDVISPNQLSWTLVNGVHFDAFGDFRSDAFGNPEGTIAGFEVSDRGQFVLSVSELNLPLEDFLFPGEGYGEMMFRGDDVITGSQLGDHISALSGNDAVFGRGGSDTLAGNRGNDFVHGNTGNDFVFGGKQNDELRGGQGNDFVHGNTGNDSLFGGKGNDELRGGQGDDFLHGNPGNDFLFGGNGNDELRGGQGDDLLQGATGGDVGIGAKGNDVVRGGQGNDQLRGSWGNDQLFGARGDDRLNGGVGDDVLTGGEGEDVFVFDQPGAGIYTGADTITDFVLGQDLIEIAAQVNDTDISSDEDVLQRLSPHEAGGTLIDLEGGNSIHLVGIDHLSLDAGDFAII